MNDGSYNTCEEQSFDKPAHHKATPESLLFEYGETIPSNSNIAHPKQAVHNSVNTGRGSSIYMQSQELTIQIVQILRSAFGWQFKIMNLRNIVFCEEGYCPTTAFSCLVVLVSCPVFGDKCCYTYLQDEHTARRLFKGAKNLEIFVSYISF